MNSNRTQLYTVALTLIEDVVVKPNTNGKPLALARGNSKSGKKLTVMTYVKAGIAALEGLKAGASVRLYGTFTQVKDSAGKVTGRVFSAMGASTPKAKAGTTVTA